MEGGKMEADMSVEEISNLVKEGWKNLNLKNIQKAVDDLQRACSLLSEKFGETSYECAEALFMYGFALIEQSRIDNCLLGNALKGIEEQAIVEQPESTEGDAEVPAEDSFLVQDGTTVEEIEKISEEVIDAMIEKEGNEKVQTLGQEADNKDEAGNGSDKVECKTKCADEAEKPDSMEVLCEADNADETENVDEEENADEIENGDEVENGDEEGNADEAEDADVGTLQLAWEVLELSRTIYEKEYLRLKEKEADPKDLSEIALKEADCLLKLAEVGVENETYDSAIDDYFKCRDLLKKAELPKDHRRFAEVSYDLGLAYGYKCLYDLSKAHYEEALEIIETRISNYQRQLEDMSMTEAERNDLKAEIESLSSLIPDIKIKMEDCLEVMNQTKPEIGCEVSVGFGETPPSSEGDASATNVIHLVRKKRKSEDDVLNKKKKVKVSDEVTDAKPAEPSEEAGEV